MQQACWNAGVVGLSEKATAYLPDVLALCDTIHSLFPKHLSEQMAFNIVMSRHFRLKGFSDVSYHWFGHGQAINHIIDRVLSNLHQDSLEELIIKVRAVKQEVLHAPLNPDKLPWYRKWFF